jgi:hypothetical protein
VVKSAPQHTVRNERVASTQLHLNILGDVHGLFGAEVAALIGAHLQLVSERFNLLLRRIKVQHAQQSPQLSDRKFLLFFGNAGESRSDFHLEIVAR